VALLLDGSGSMKVGSGQRALAAHLRAILSSLNPSRDDAALYSFDTRLLSVQEFTHDLKTVTDRVSVVDAWGSRRSTTPSPARPPSSPSAPPNRRALVVLTDGADTASAYSPEQVSAIASAVDVPVYVFVMATMTREGEKVPFEAERRSTLANLARATGGDFFVAYDPAPRPPPSTSWSKSCGTSTCWPSRRRRNTAGATCRSARARRASWSAPAAGTSPAPPNSHHAGLPGSNGSIGRFSAPFSVHTL
jgi:hypothetical protein